MNRFLIFLFPLQFISLTLLAQQRPLAEAPSIRLPQDRASYLICPATSIAPESADPLRTASTDTPKNLVSVQVERYGATQRNTYTWDDHTKTQEWLLDTTYLIETPTERGFLVYQVGEDYFPWTATKRLSQKSFFAWVNSSTFVRLEKFENKPANFFSDPITGNKAWVDPTTSLPVACEVDETLFLIKFLPPPEAQLQLPEKVLRILKAAEEQAATAKPITVRLHPRP